MSEFGFNDAAVALEMRKIERRVGSCDDLRHAALKEIERQLLEAGAPDAPLEDQLRAMLSAYTAMQRAEGMSPSATAVRDAINSAYRDWIWEPEKYAALILDLFRPIIARLTQERDEARAATTELRADLERSQEHEQDLLAALATHQVDAATLRQRADRAEVELAEARANEKTIAELFESLSEDHGDAQEANEILRARIAELESRPEPGADVVEHAAVAFGRAYRATAGLQEHGQPLNDPTLAGIRAVVSALAAMGEEAWPRVDEAELDRLWSLFHENDGGTSGVEAVLRHFYRSRLSHILGALRARVAELDSKLASAEKRANHEAYMRESDKKWDDFKPGSMK